MITDFHPGSSWRLRGPAGRTKVPSSSRPGVERGQKKKGVQGRQGRDYSSRREVIRNEGQEVFKIQGQQEVLNPWSVAREHVAWWRAQGGSAHRAMSALGLRFDSRRQGWDDVIAAYAAAWRKLRHDMGAACG